MCNERAKSAQARRGTNIRRIPNLNARKQAKNGQGPRTKTLSQTQGHPGGAAVHGRTGKKATGGMQAGNRSRTGEVTKKHSVEKQALGPLRVW